MRYLKIGHRDVHTLIDILDELEEKTREEFELLAKLNEIYRRMRNAKKKKFERAKTKTELQSEVGMV